LAHRALDVAGPLLLLSLFYFMNYQKIYDQIIEKAKTRKLKGYKEKHHIIPRCIGGGNEKSNIVELTAREHFLCHWLLHEIHPTNSKLAFAFWAMCNQKNPNQKERYIPSSRTYEYAKKLHCYFITVNQKGKVFSEEHKKNISEAKKRSQSRLGKKLTEESKKKISNAIKGKKLSEKHRKNIVEGMKGKPRKKHSEETKQKIANTQKIKFQLRKNNIIL
jgi:hypothetical protein